VGLVRAWKDQHGTNEIAFFSTGNHFVSRGDLFDNANVGGSPQVT